MLDALVRLRGEADAVGIAIRLVERAPDQLGNPADQLAQVVRAIGPAAAVKLVPSVAQATEPPVAAAMDVWFFNGFSGETSVGHLTVEGGQGENTDQVLAIRVVDFIRARMFDAIVRRNRDTAKPAAPATIAPAAPRSTDAVRGRRWFSAGVAGTGSASGFSPSFSPYLQVGFGLRPWLWLTLAGAGFGGRVRVSTAAGSAEIGQRTICFGAAVLPRSWWRLAPLVSAGAAVAFVDVHGQGASGFVGHDRAATFLGAFASAGGIVMLTSHLVFQVSAGTLWLLREPKVVIADVEVARTGRPAWLSSAALGVTF
jgi:hypothetical protein